MKKLSLFIALAFVISAFAVFSLAANAADNVVYIGGQSDTYKTLKEAADALPAGGGTIVVRGAVVHGNDSGDAVTLPAKPLVITSVYGGKDYREEGAYFGLGRTLKLSADATFENIIIKQTHTNSTYGNIYAQCHSITMGEGITTESEAGTGKYPTVFGGFSGGDNGTGYTTDVTIKSGTWQNVYGGSYGGKFNGDSSVTMTGGAVANVISGGSRNGTQVGDTKLVISGGSVYCACGGIYGVSGSSGALTGDIDVDIFGNTVIENNVFGIAYYGNIVFQGNVDIDIYGNANLKRHVYGGCYGVSGKQNITLGNDGMLITLRENVTFTRPSDTSNVLSGGSTAGTVGGDVRIVIKDNVYFTGNVYGAGYSGSVNGNSTVEIYGGEVRVNFTAASRSGNVSGTATTLAYGGRIGYFTSDEAPYDVLGTNLGTVGSAVVVLDGADVAGSVALNGASGTVTLKSGKAGTAPDKCYVDLSGGKPLEVGGAVSAYSVIGGGSLRLSANGTLTTDAMSGEVALSVSGEPLANQAYITVNDVNTSATVSYTPVDDDILEKQVGANKVEYVVKYEARYETTKVHIDYYNPLGSDKTQPKIVIKVGLNANNQYTTAEKVTGSVDGKNFVETDLEPGLYCCKVYYGNGSADYRVKYFYVSGKTETMTIDMPFTPYIEDSWTESRFTHHTDEVMALFGTEGLVGYKPFDTPTFDLQNNTRTFMDNDALCDYVDKLADACSYLYVFYPFAASAMGNETPVLVFTNDDIEGLDFDAAAKKIRDGGEREILMISGGVHGNEPAGPEGVLAFAHDLAGDYGVEVMESFGAIVIIPSVSVDNFQRFKRETAEGVNPNRVLISASLESTRNQIYVYTSFMPTVAIDCHEDSGNPEIDAADHSLENLNDICVRYTNQLNTIVNDISAIYNGTQSAMDFRGNQIMVDVIDALGELGLRSSIYGSASSAPTHSTGYYGIRGSYAFILETMRIWSGVGRYERAVFGMQQGLKAIVAEIIEADGAIAKDVYENRARMEQTVDYSEDNLFILKHSQSGKSEVIVNRPTIYESGIWKDKNGTKSYLLMDTAAVVRPLPTAYVFAADTEGVDEILALLDNQGISYTRLAEGTELTLRGYTGSYTGASINAPETVVFENGAYAVTLNTVNAYLIAYLFEPDSYPYSSAEETTISLASMGYFENCADIYRSEEDGVYLKIAQLEEQGRITHTGMTVGSDLAVNAFVSLKDENAEVSVRFTLEDEEIVVENGVFDNELGLYKFTLSKMPPHAMTANVDIELIIDGEVVYTVEDWTVRKYCDTLIASTAEELGISEDKKSALDVLVKDMLAYGAAAQEYKSFVDLEHPLANDGIVDATEFAELNASSASCIGAGTDAVKFVGVGVRFDTVNNVFFKFTASDVSRVKIIIDGTEYLASDFEAAGNGTYVVYSNAILATGFDSIITAVSYADGEALQTVRYSVASFVYEMQNDKDGEELTNTAKLARRLYTYGVSANAYVSIGG